ncbi:MAG: hypothetical protein AAB628_02960 [Patescibacteria group bacterium]
MKYEDSSIHLAVFKEENAGLEASLVVYAEEKRLFLGEMFTFNVIGWSHYISCPALSYHEIISGITIPNLDMLSFDLLEKNPPQKISFETPTHTAIIDVWLTTFHDDPMNTENANLCHVFPNNACTAITVNETSYETIHSYPEFNKNLYTRTTFTPKD